jgi:hypothetical protein
VFDCWPGFELQHAFCAASGGAITSKVAIETAIAQLQNFARRKNSGNGKFI